MSPSGARIAEKACEGSTAKTGDKSSDTAQNVQLRHILPPCKLMLLLDKMVSPTGFEPVTH